MTTLALPSAATLTQLSIYEQVVYGYLAQCQCEATLRAYTEDLKNYDAWCTQQSIQPLGVSKAHLDLYVRWMQAQGRWAESTISRRIGTVCGMLKYAADEDYIPKNPAARLNRPTVDRDKQHRTWMNPTDFGTLRKTAEAAGPRELGLVALLGMMGLRIGEACSLNVQDITQQSGYTVISFIGKGNRTAVAPVPVPALSAITGLVDGRQIGPLLLNHHGKRMDRATAARMLKNLCQQAGLEQHITPHGLRRTFATSALLAKVPIYEVQIAMRHKSVATTSLYDMARNNPDRNATHAIAGFMASMTG